MAKIFMGLKKKNEKIELTDDFILEKEETKYPNGFITGEDCIQLDIKNENLACIFPIRAGVWRILENLILQENHKNIIVFDINGIYLKNTAGIKLYNGYEIISLNKNQTNIQKENAIRNVKNAEKFIIYINIMSRDIEGDGKDPILKFLFNEIKDFNLLTIVDETPAFIETGMVFLKELAECKNNQLIFKFQDEKQFSLKDISKEYINKLETAGLNKELLLNLYKNMNILEIPEGKIEGFEFETYLFDKYKFINKKSGKSLTTISPTTEEVKIYLNRYY